jgi:hypothetical protein
LALHHQRGCSRVLAYDRVEGSQKSIQSSQTATKTSNKLQPLDCRSHPLHFEPKQAASGFGRGHSVPGLGLGQSSGTFLRGFTFSRTHRGGTIRLRRQHLAGVVFGAACGSNSVSSAKSFCLSPSGSRQQHQPNKCDQRMDR